jgi:tripeptidyl-peptidase-1
VKYSLRKDFDFSENVGLPPSLQRSFELLFFTTKCCMAGMSLVIFTFVLLLALEATAGAVGKTAFREHGWRRKLLAPRDGPMKLHIAVRLEDGGQEAERKLLEISDPNSPSYRQHLGPEAAYLSTPGQGSVHAIEYWLWKYNLLGNSSLFGGIYSVDTTVRTAERLLNTTYFVWSDGSQDVVRTERFYLPDEVVGHIDFVAPTTTFPKAASVGWPSQLARGKFSEPGTKLVIFNFNNDNG